MSFNEDNALFSVTNVIDKLTWKIWISAVGTDGIKSGISAMQNIQLYFWDPPEIDTNVAVFRFNDLPEDNYNGTVTKNMYYETYKNLTWYDYPKVYTIRRYITYYLPPRFDAFGLPITVNITHGIKDKDDPLIKYEPDLNRIVIDKKYFFADAEKIK